MGLARQFSHYGSVGLLLACWACTADSAVDPYVLPLPDTPTYRTFDVPGNLAWQVPLRPDSARFEPPVPPVLSDGWIIYATEGRSATVAGHTLVAVDAEGVERWQWTDYEASLRSNAIQAMAVADGSVVIQTERQYYGIDAADGRTLWSRDMIGGRGPLVAFDGRVYQRFNYYQTPDSYDGRSIRRFEAATGAHSRVVGQLHPDVCYVDYSTPAVRRGTDGAVRVYYTVRTCSPANEPRVRYRAYNEQTGQHDFDQVVEGEESFQPGAPLLDDTRVYVLGTRYAAALDAQSGNLRWRRDTNDLFVGSHQDYSLLPDGLLVGTYTGSYAFDGEGGSLLYGSRVRPDRGTAFAPPHYYTLREEIQRFDPLTGQQTGPRIGGYNERNGFGHPEARFEYGAVVDPERARLYAADGYYLAAFDLPL